MKRNVKARAALAVWMVAGLMAGLAWGQAGGQGGGPAGESGAVPAVPPRPAVIQGTVDVSRDGALPGLLTSMSEAERTYFHHVATLTSPFFEGRNPGDRGNELAAEYIEFWFRQAGLRPAFPVKSGETSTPFASYRQPFEFGSRMTFPRKDVLANGQRLEAGEDYNVLGMSASGSVIGKIAFVGYGIQGRRSGEGENATVYNSYGEGQSVEGKIAMVMRFEPLNEKGRSRWSTTGGFSSASGITPKLRELARRKPAAIVLVNPPGVDDERAGKLEDWRSLRLPGANADLGVPVIMMSETAAARLIGQEAGGLMGLRQKADEAGGVTLLDGAALAIDIEIKREPVITDNVGAVLEGRGALKDEYIVVGGHYDHLGYGFFGSRDPSPRGKLHPGADDNASGTAGVLLAAKGMAKMYADLPPDANVRSIMFVGFTAEESGLNGARYMIRNMPVEAKNVYAMLNMDMIGRYRPNIGVQVEGVGTAEGFEDLLDPVFAASGLTVRKGQGGRGPSDHSVFFGAGIPVLHFFTGLHAEYHMPIDTLETLNFVGAVRVADLTVQTAKMLAARTEPLVFVNTRARTRIEMPADVAPDRQGGPGGPSGAAPGAGPGAGPGAAPAGTPVGSGDQPAGPMGGVRVRFGIAPGDYSGDVAGVAVGDVFPGTSAANAGLKSGDVITSWNGKAVASVEEWMPLLATHAPGDKVKVEFVRAGAKQTVEVVLQGRVSVER